MAGIMIKALLLDDGALVGDPAYPVEVRNLVVSQQPEVEALAGGGSLHIRQNQPRRHDQSPPWERL
jgi:hypothetical protein